MGSWQVALAGPERVVGPVAAILGCVRLEEALPSLDVTIGRNGRARGTVRGEALWALALPQARWLPLLVGQIVAAATVLLRRHLFVHAGVVAIEGRGWVLIGGSGAGKTSTVAVLVREGAAYLSDEVALLDPERATVAPFTLPMAVKPWTLQAAGALPEGRDVATEGDTRFHLPDRRAEGPLPIAGLVVFDPARPAAPLTTAHRAETLMAMAEYPSTMRYRDRLEEAFPAFARLLRQVNCYALGAPGPEPITRAGLFGVLRRAAAAGSDR
ncbi:MAG: hypothetical protein HY334_00495 [Armatimonadetes bacterium]|nr:hypothetical protein [Armatimonadota bacterium]